MGRGSGGGSGAAGGGRSGRQRGAVGGGGLPTLEGSEKQVAWANTLRDQTISDLNKAISSEKDPVIKSNLSEIKAAFSESKNAKTFIEFRGADVRSMAESMAEAGGNRSTVSRVARQTITEGKLGESSFYNLVEFAGRSGK